MLYIIGTGCHSDVVQNIVGFPSTVISMETFVASQKNYTADDKFICAVGDNEKRKELVAKTSPFLKWVNAVHKSAIIADNVTMGIGNVICAGVVIQPKTHIGDHCILNTQSNIDHHCQIDSFVHVAPNSTLCGNIRLGEGCFLGASATVVPDLTLSPWSFIKAGQLVKHSTGPIPMYRPFIKESFLEHIRYVVEIGALTSQTPFKSYVKKCQDWFVEKFQCKHALLVNNGTSATHCLFLALKFKYPQVKKIYLPNHVYVAVWNTALYEYNADELEILPVDEKSWNVDETSLLSLDANSAVVIVHNIGNVVNVPRLQAQRPDLIFLEDNCEALFGKYNNQYTGTASFCASLSFFANKTLTSAEGGAFLTNDTKTYNYIKKTINQGMTSERYVHDILGYNYRITNMQAALLLPQLIEHECILQKKEHVFEQYKRLLTHPLISWAHVDPTTTPAQWMVAIRIRGLYYSSFGEYMAEHLIETRPMFFHIHKHGHFQNILVQNSNSLRSEEITMLPSFPDLTDQEIQYICQKIIDYCNQLECYMKY